MVKKDAKKAKTATADVSGDDESPRVSDSLEKPVPEAPYDWRIDGALIAVFFVMAAVTRFINIEDPKSVIFDEVRCAAVARSFHAGAEVGRV